MTCFSCLFSQKAASSVKRTVEIDEGEMLMPLFCCSYVEIIGELNN